MESFLDMTLDRNLYIGVPVGAFLCSLFLLFCILLFQYHEEPDSP